MNDNNLIWVTGNKGFVGSVIERGLQIAGFKTVGTGSELSVCEPERLEAFAEEIQPAAIVNCAGIRRDAATLDNKVRAYEVNALGARNVAYAANAVGAKMVQISTDDVYSSPQLDPVNEFDAPEPNTPYGKSKQGGEMMVRNAAPDHLILRTSWLYQSSTGRFRDILEAAKSGRKYEARTDQFAAPASVGMYLHYLTKMLERDAKGTFHITPKGKTNRYGFAEKILEYAGYDPTAVLVPAEDPETAEDIVLESMMLEIAGAELPTWEEDLHNYMEYKGLLAE